MTSIVENLIGKKIGAKTPYHFRKSIFLKQIKGLKFLYAIGFDNINFTNLYRNSNLSK
jgi:hypothetical protein